MSKKPLSCFPSGITFIVTRFFIPPLLLCFAALMAGEVVADSTPGGPRSGRVLVVANSNSPLSLELAAEYRRARNLPANNQLNLALAHKITLPAKKFHNQLLEPVMQRIQQLDGNVDFIVLMRDVPYRTGKISTTTALFFQGHDKLRPQHGYFQRHEPFDGSVTYAGQRLYPGTVISGYSIGDAMKLIERSLVRYDDKEEAGTIYLCEGQGPRGIRNRQNESALRNLQEAGMSAKHVRDYNIVGRDDVLAQFTGITRLRLGKNKFRPGSIVDNVTSYGGFLLESKSQTQILDYIAHGACASYGTVSEPTNDPRRWPDLKTLLRYAEGFNIAESYYQNVLDWKFGCLVADPLMAPFAKPPEIDLRDLPKRAKAGDAVEFTLRMREGRKKEGISWAEVWLDDQYRLAEWTPEIPADTVSRLNITLDEERIFQAEHEVDKETDYRQVLEEIVEKTSEKINISLVGKHRHKMLVRLPIKSDLKNKKLACSFSFNTPDGETYERTYDLNVNVLQSRSAVLRFGTDNPEGGERIEAMVAGEQVSLTALTGESIESFVKRFARELFQTQKLGPKGEFSMQLAKQEGDGDAQESEYMIHIRPKDPYSNAVFPMQIDIERQDGSEFAPDLAKGMDEIWQLRPLGAVAEAVIQPFTPAAEVEKEVTIPASLVNPGKYVLQGIGASPRGAFNEQQVEFEVSAAGENDIPDFKMESDVVDWGDELSFELKPHGIPDDAAARLLIDGKVRETWDAGVRAGTFTVNKESLAPGKHQAQIEWFTGNGGNEEDEGSASSPSGQRSFVGKTAPRDFWIRRPLLYKTEWRPGKAAAEEEISIEIDGPYLNDSAYIEINGEKHDLERVSRSKARWGVELKAPAEAGEYDVRLSADPAKYKGGKLDGKLQVRN